MSVWWRLAYILTPSLSFASGFALAIASNWWLLGKLESGKGGGSFYDSMWPGIFLTTIYKSLGWGFGLAVISTVILTIILYIKKPWKGNNKP